MVGNRLIEIGKESEMVLNEEHRELVPRMEELLVDLDRLQLTTVAAHVDLALRRLESIIAGNSSNTDDK